MTERSVKRPAGATHTPCCSSHGVYMTCLDYRRTHFVEVGSCCAAWQDDEAGQLADAERMAAITAEQESIRQAEREVSWVIAPAITTALNGIDRLISRGTITEEQATNALASFPDFADAWEEYIA